MSIQSSRSLLSGSLFALIAAAASACQPASQNPNNALSPGAINKTPNASMKFVSEGRRMVPDRLQHTPAELIYEDRIGGFVLPKLDDNQLYVVFRDNRRQVDMVYRMNSGSGEIVYFFNDNPQDREITTDHQLVVDVSDGDLRSMNIYRRDLSDEMLGAFKRRDITMMSKLLNSNPALSNAPYSGGMTLLMLADDLRVAKMAIDAGADVNAKDINGNTPLHYAAYYDNKEVAELLVARMAYIDAKNHYGDTPLHFAVLQKSRAITNYLIENGANSNIKNGAGKTPLGMALDN